MCTTALQAVPSWFVKAESARERMIANNAQTYWVPGKVILTPPRHQLSSDNQMIIPACQPASQSQAFGCTLNSMCKA